MSLPQALQGIIFIFPIHEIFPEDRKPNPSLLLYIRLTSGFEHTH